MIIQQNNIDISRPNLRIRKMAWQHDATYLWHLVFTDRCVDTWPKRSILHSYFLFMNLGFNQAHEANGPNDTLNVG
jgi:hypothetical protein